MGRRRARLEGLAVALALTGTVDAGAQVAQGLSGFTLPASPLLVLHAICMSQLLLLPLFLRRTSLRGLDRMPPQAQVRGGALAAILTLAGLPVLLLTTLALADEQSWTVPFSLAVMTLLLLLAAGRHLLNVRETQRLYGHLESASEERRACWPRSCAGSTTTATGWPPSCTSRPCRPTPRSCRSSRPWGHPRRRAARARSSPAPPPWCATTSPATPSRCGT